MCWIKVVSCNSVGFIIRVSWCSLSIFFILILSKFSDVSVIVSSHFLVKHLGFWRSSILYKMLFKKIKHSSTKFIEFVFNSSFIFSNLFNIVLLFSSFHFLLLDWGQDSPSCSSGSHNIFKSNRENISLFRSQICWIHFCKLSCKVNHF